MPEAVLYELRRDAAWLTLNQPEKRNALSDAVVATLLQHLQRANVDPQVRTIVITGAGSAFCAGADLKSGGMRADDAENPFVTVMKMIWNGPKPVIARINGPAFGGGVGLAAACDIAVAADSVAFSFSDESPRLRLVSDYLAENLIRQGPLTSKGRQRAALTAYLSVVDRTQRIATSLGLTRREKSVPTIADYLAGKKTGGRS